MDRKLSLVLALVSLMACAPKTSTPLPEIKDGWIEITAAYGAAPMAVRFNEGLLPAAGHPAYSQRVGITVKLREAGEDGLSLPSEESALQNVEKELVSTFCRDRLCLLGVVSTSEGVREFVFYTRDQRGAQQAFRDVQTKIPDYELKLFVQADPHWGAYNQFKPAN